MRVLLLEVVQIVDAEAAPKRLGRSARRRRHDGKAHTAMNRKDRASIVQDIDGIETRVAEQMPTQRGRARVAERAGRQDKSDAPAAPNELQRSFHKQLVAVDV